MPRGSRSASAVNVQCLICRGGVGPPLARTPHRCAELPYRGAIVCSYKTPPLYELPPGFAVFAFSEVASVRCVITNQFALHSLTRNFILFEKRESLGDRLRWRSFQRGRVYFLLCRGGAEGGGVRKRGQTILLGLPSLL